MKVKSSNKGFNTPINIGGVTMTNPEEKESVDERIDTYLRGRRGRILEEAKMAELEHVVEDERTGAARSRKERQLVEGGLINPIKGEEVTVEENEKKVAEAAEVAAEAASAGVGPEAARDLGIGKSKVVVIKPEVGGEAGKGEGGWTVFNGRPIKDPDGEYTFSQALKVAQLEVPHVQTGDSRKSLAEELAEAKLKLEAIGVKVGSPAPTSPRSLKEEVADALSLLESLGLDVKTNKQAPLKEQVAEAKSLLEGLGLSIGIPGESIESVREKHHHEEKMKELETEKSYKDKLGETLSDLPEKVGRGLGSQILEAEEGGGSSSGGGLNYFICEEEGCGAKIPVPPNMGKATCPKCGAIYFPTGTVETKQE